MDTESILKALWNLADEIHRSPRQWDPETIAERVTALGLRLDGEGAGVWYPRLLQMLRLEHSPLVVPPVVISAVKELLQGRSASLVLDPFAGLGTLLGGALSVLPAARSIACTRVQAEYTLGRALLPQAEWMNADPVSVLQGLDSQPDVIVSIPPFGMRTHEPISVIASDGTQLEVKGDYGSGVIVAALERMAPKGIGVFVVPTSFFFSDKSVYRQFDRLDLGLEAALALMPGSFAPYANISAYLLVIRKGPVQRTFTAQLTGDGRTNKQVVSNFKNGREAESIELGGFVDPATFRGIDAIRTAQRLAEIERRFGSTPLPLADFAVSVNLGRSGADFSFAEQPNAVYIPMIGSSDVVDSIEDLKLKPQNYAQVVIDPTRSNAAFVARFLNSEFGKEIRQNSMNGFIPKLNKQTLKQLEVFIPSLAVQEALLEMEGRIAAEQNVLSGLQNELNAMRREAWSDPRTIGEVDVRLRSLSERMSGGLKRHAAKGLENWFDTLPFPLASILRAWQATPTQDHRMKHEHLLHFFEATAEFLSVILLSAFSSNSSLFQAHKQKLISGLEKQHLSFERATFGTWKTVIDYLGRQTKLLLQEDGKKPEDAKNDRATCAELFADHSLELATILAKPELAAVIATTNKLRNDWKGHGGVLGNEEAALRNEAMIAELQKLRDVMEDAWEQVQLVHALHCRPKQGIFANEVAMLMGSNSEFLKETRTMATWLDVERLYIARKGSPTALKLLPLIQVGASPSSAKNACYFFNRLDRSGARFVSYHYVDKPEMTGAFADAEAAIKFLSEA